MIDALYTEALLVLICAQSLSFIHGPSILQPHYLKTTVIILVTLLNLLDFKTTCPFKDCISRSQRCTTVAFSGIVIHVLRQANGLTLQMWKIYI